MTDLLIDGGSLVDPRHHLADAWAEHVARAGERQAALGALHRLEARLEAWVQQPSMPRLSMPTVPRLTFHADLERVLQVACIALLVLGVAGLSVVGDNAIGSRQDRVADRAGSIGPDDKAAALAAAALGSKSLGQGASVERAPSPIVPSARGALPVGKGMWMWKPEAAEGGDPEAVVQRARAAGLTHIYVRTGSSKMGFHAAQYLSDLLPRAHREGIRVYGWDFPYLFDVQADVNRAVQAITFEAPGGHRIDGFSADIETTREGVNITAAGAAAYGATLRRAVGMAYPLIATVPRPSPVLVTYPFAEVVASFDAIAPMVYWLNREPAGDLHYAMGQLRRFNKPIIPVGQAYDGWSEGGRPGVPPRHELQTFIRVADELGALGVSFWSWQHAGREAWDAIRDAPEFTLPSTPPGSEAVGFTPGQIRMYQGLLTSLGFPVAVTGQWNAETAAALRNYQDAARLPATGLVDDATRALLLTPFAAPIAPIA